MRLGRIMESLASPFAGVSAAGFAALSAARRKRFFHPRGTVFDATITIFEESALLEAGSFPGVIRFSRGVGLPEATPDVLGLAVKIPDLGQDILLVTSGEGAASRHLLLASGGFFRRPYSTVLPFEWSEESIVLGAQPDVSLEEADDRTFEDLETQVSLGRLLFHLTWGRTGTADQTRFGSIVADGIHEGEVAFDPFRCHPSLRPSGALNRLRRDTYPASRAARPDH